jgi:hypothetical protein
MNRSIILFAGSISLACSATPDEVSTGQSTPAGSPGKGAPAAQAEQPVEAPTQTYTLELGGTHTITYRAFRDGSLIVSEQGDLTKDKPVGQTMGILDPVEAFRRVRPGESVPPELESLEVVAESETPGEADDVVAPPRVEAPAAAGLIPKLITSDPNTFLNIFGCFFGSGDVYDVCLPNRGDWANVPGTAPSRWAIYKVGSYLGDITVRISLAGVVRVVYPVFQGQFNWNWARGPLRTYVRPQGWLQPSLVKTYPDPIAHRYELIDAAGDRFHLSVRLHNYQFNGPNCAEISSSDTSQWVPDGEQADCPHNHYQ